MAEQPAHDSTLRFRASSRLAYGQALVALAEHARGSVDDFEFGPMDLSALEHQGLLVTGPKLAVVRAVLAKIPGITEE